MELNPFVKRSAQIEWFCGRSHIRPNQKFSRVREDHLEVLLINNVQSSDSELYSITVDKDIYPVAYLIIEDGSSMKENRYFITPSQTVFCMEGQVGISRGYVHKHILYHSVSNPLLSIGESALQHYLVSWR